MRQTWGQGVDGAAHHRGARGCPKSPRRKGAVLLSTRGCSSILAARTQRGDHKDPSSRRSLSHRSTAHRIRRSRCRSSARQAGIGRPVIGAARKHPQGARRESRRRRDPRLRRAGRAARQGCVLRGVRRAEPEHEGADGARLDLPHLFHDQADHQRRGDDPGRGGQDQPVGTGLDVPARARQPAGGDQCGQRQEPRRGADAAGEEPDPRRSTC